MPRRPRGRLTEEQLQKRKAQRQEDRRRARNRNQRKERVRARLRAFVADYVRLCRKHRSYIAHIGCGLSIEPYWSGKKARAYHDKESVEQDFRDFQTQAEEWWDRDV